MDVFIALKTTKPLTGNNKIRRLVYPENPDFQSIYFFIDKAIKYNKFPYI